MPLRYGLLKNQLRNTHGYVAVTTDVRYVDLEQLIDQMTGSGSTVTKAEILGVWVELEQAITHFVQQGYAVKTPLFSIIPKVTGVFDGPDDTFSPAKHQIKLHIRTTKRLQSLSKKIKVEKIPIETAAPSIASITDLWSGAIGHTLTIGQFASVKGKLLKLFEGDEFQVGEVTVQVTRIDERAVELDAPVLERRLQDALGQNLAEGRELTEAGT